MLQDHIKLHTALGECLLLEQYAFQIWSWSIFNLECSSRLLMVQNHKVLMIQNHMVLDHKSRPKSQNSNATAATLLCPAVNLGVSRSLAQIHSFHYHHYAKNTGKYGAILKTCFVLNNFVYVSYCHNLRIISKRRGWFSWYDFKRKLRLKAYFVIFLLSGWLTAHKAIVKKM